MNESWDDTIGGRRVRVGFNPSRNEIVDTFKMQTAAAINTLEQMKVSPVNGSGNLDPEAGEKNRLIALAQTAYEEAAMWAVKAATS